jgi:hypothetical protein
MRYIQFVIVATAIFFVLMMVGLAVTGAVYRTQYRWSEAAVVFLQSALFMAAIVGLSRPVFPCVRNPDRPWWQ